MISVSGKNPLTIISEVAKELATDPNCIRIEAAQILGWALLQIKLDGGVNWPEQTTTVNARVKGLAAATAGDNPA